jgi:hypothetical protein
MFLLSLYGTEFMYIVFNINQVLEQARILSYKNRFKILLVESTYTL